MFYIRRGRRTHSRKVVHKTRQKQPVRSLKRTEPQRAQFATLPLPSPEDSPLYDWKSRAAGAEAEDRLDDLMRDRG